MKRSGVVRNSLGRFHALGEVIAVVPKWIDSEWEFQTLFESHKFVNFIGSLDDLLQTSLPKASRGTYLDQLFGFKSGECSDIRTTALGKDFPFILLPSGKAVFHDIGPDTQRGSLVFSDVLDEFKLVETKPDLPTGVLVSSQLLKGNGSIVALRERWADSSFQGHDSWPSKALRRECVDFIRTEREDRVFYTWNSPLVCSGLGLFRLAEKISLHIKKKKQGMTSGLNSKATHELGEEILDTSANCGVDVFGFVPNKCPVVYNMLFRVDLEKEMTLDRSSRYGVKLVLDGDNMVETLGIE